MAYRFLRVAVSRGSALAAPAKLTLLSAPPIATSFRLALEGTPGTVYTVERSTDFQTWTFFQTVTAGSSPVTVTDSEVAANRFRFYRAVAK